MSNNVSLLKHNGYLLFVLLLSIIVSSGFIVDEDVESSERRKRKKIVETAQKYIGTKYRTGGKTPKGFDCSGFSSYVFKKNKIEIGPSSRSQSLQGESVKIRNLQAGDLIFFGSNNKVSHVGIVSKKSRNQLVMIHASSSRGIIEENVYDSTYWEKRIIGGRSML